METLRIPHWTNCWLHRDHARNESQDVIVVKKKMLFPDRTKELLLAIVWVVEQLVVEEFHKVTSLSSLCI